MRLNRRLQLAFFFSTLIGAVLFLYIFYSEKGELQLTESEIKYFGFSLILGNVAGLGMFFLSRFLNQKAPWHLATALRFMVELVIMALWIFLLAYGMLRLFLHWQDLNPTAFYKTYHDALLKLIILGVVIILIYTILDFTLYSYNQYAAVQIESVQVASTQLALQLEVLKSQLSPHYLFNSLNTISSIMYANPEVAEQFIRKLAHTYQYILATQDKQLVPLSEELNFVQAYFFLLKARFGPAVHLSLELPRRTYTSNIPPLTLQLLLENAVKHNAPSPDSPLYIRIYLSDKNLLTVSNNILSPASRPKSYQIGLANIRQRYQYYAQAAISVVKADDFVVELPLLYTSLSYAK